MRCPYCCADLSRSFREFPVMSEAEYVKHVVENHEVSEDLAPRQYDIRFSWAKEEL